jgi:hypothetical protein
MILISEFAGGRRDDTHIRIRGYFWRRVFAGLVDAIFIGAIVTLIGVSLFGPTGGKIRLEQTLFTISNCVAPDNNNLKINPADLMLPADFRVTGAGKCTSTFMGFVHDRRLVVQEVTKPTPATTYMRRLTYPLDEEGRLQIPVFYLDYLTYILLVVYVLWLEWRFGATLGKNLLKLRVRSLSAPDGKLTFVQAAKRLLIFAWFIPIVIGLLLGWILDFSLSDYFSFLIWFFAISGLIAMSICVNVAYAIWHGERPWHDRWANTAVVLGRDQSIAPTPL